MEEAREEAEGAMGSEPDDDARSFGSEPDFAAMSSLRIASETDAGPSPTGHVFDELLEDPPRPFDHDLREAEATSLQALLDGFDTLLRREDDDEDDDDEGEGRAAETTGVRDASRPRRVRSDRQNEMVPVPELARRWRRITRRDALNDAGSTRGATSGQVAGCRVGARAAGNGRGIDVGPQALGPHRRDFIVVAVDRRDGRSRGGMVVRRDGRAGVLHGDWTRA